MPTLPALAGPRRYPDRANVLLQGPDRRGVLGDASFVLAGGLSLAQVQPLERGKVAPAEPDITPRPFVPARLGQRPLIALAPRSQRVVVVRRGCCETGPSATA